MWKTQKAMSNWYWKAMSEDMIGKVFRLIDNVTASEKINKLN